MNTYVININKVVLEDFNMEEFKCPVCKSQYT